MKKYFFQQKISDHKKKSENFQHFGFFENVGNFQIFFCDLRFFVGKNMFLSDFFIFPKINSVYFIVTKYEGMTTKTLKVMMFFSKKYQNIYILPAEWQNQGKLILIVANGYTGIHVLWSNIDRVRSLTPSEENAYKSDVAWAEKLCSS